MTLVEVAAGLALLGTLLVAILMTEGRCRRQSAGARDRIAACAVADQLLQKWYAQPEKFPRSDSGEFDSQGFWTWRTRPVENPSLAQVGCQLMRLEVFAQDSGQDRPAAVVDVALPAQKN